MPVGDGRYVTMAQVQEYADSVASQAATWNATALSVLASAIQRAEASIDGFCGSAFDDDVVLSEVPSKAWLDWQGWIHIFGNQRGPITKVTAVKYRMRDAGAWSTLTWNSPDDIILPNLKVPPSPNSWEVQIYPGAPMMPGALVDYASGGFTVPGGISPSDIMFRWDYEGGYFPIPDALAAIACRLTFFYYKLREAPMARILSAELGVMEFPLNIPPDLKQDLSIWRRTIR